MQFSLWCRKKWGTGGLHLLKSPYIFKFPKGIPAQQLRRQIHSKVYNWYRSGFVSTIVCLWVSLWFKKTWDTFQLFPYVTKADQFVLDFCVYFKSLCLILLDIGTHNWFFLVLMLLYGLNPLGELFYRIGHLEDHYLVYGWNMRILSRSIQIFN